MTFEESKKELQRILEPFSQKAHHYTNIELARITSPLLIIPDDVEEEEWKMLNCDKYARDRYLISSWGRVFDTINFHYPYSRICEKGYVILAVEYSDAKAKKLNNKRTHTSVRVHRLVGLAFIDNPLNKETVNHKNLEKRNNTVTNLEWLTNEENLKHAVDNNAKRKAGNVRKKLFTKEEVADIRLKHEQGASYISIAREYNIKDFITIANVVKYISYKDDFWDNLGFGRTKK